MVTPDVGASLLDSLPCRPHPFVPSRFYPLFLRVLIPSICRQSYSPFPATNAFSTLFYTLCSPSLLYPVANPSLRVSGTACPLRSPCLSLTPHPINSSTRSRERKDASRGGGPARAYTAGLWSILKDSTLNPAFSLEDLPTPPIPLATPLNLGDLLHSVSRTRFLGCRWNVFRDPDVGHTPVSPHFPPSSSKGPLTHFYSKGLPHVPTVVGPDGSHTVKHRREDSTSYIKG